MAKPPMYETDFFEWTQHTAELLRDGKVNEADVEHIAEELEDMGKRDRREVQSRLLVLITHLLKWQIQAGKRSSSWTATIDQQRDQLQLLLNDSPSLRPGASDQLEIIYRKSASNALSQTGLNMQLPEQCPYTLEQILDDNFLP
jgi:hypothetical protein